MTKSSNRSSVIPADELGASFTEPTWAERIDIDEFGERTWLRSGRFAPLGGGEDDRPSAPRLVRHEADADDHIFMPDATFYTPTEARKLACSILELCALTTDAP